MRHPIRQFLLASGALLCVALLAASSTAQIPSAFSIENNWVELAFVTDANDTVPGTSVHLQTMQRRLPLPMPGPMGFVPGSAEWTVRFNRGHDEPVGSGDCAGLGEPLEWFEVSMDGTVGRWNVGGPNPLGSLDALTLDSVMLTPGALGNMSARIQWSMTVTLEGESADYQVETLWEVMGGRPFAETRISVTRTSGGAPDFYVSQVIHPELYIESMQGPNSPDDTLVVPWVTGNLITNPADESLPFTGFLGSGLNFFPLNMAAYYDGVPDGNCFYITFDDAGDYWNELWIKAGGVTQNRFLSFRPRHVPGDIFESKAYTQPYAVRLGAITGDWWDVVDTYKEFLEDEVPWYAGPVGSPANPMPQAAKDLVAEMYMITGYAGDRMDVLNRQMMNISRALGGNVNAVWYGSYYPDTFAHWFYSGGYLPGWNSLVGAVREAQKQFDQMVAPYVNGSSAADYLDPAIPNPPPPTQTHIDVHESFMLDEDLEEEYFCYNLLGPPRHALLCAGSEWWRTAFVDQLVDIATFTDIKGVYLDFFMTSACYSSAHEHLPGGGNWMYRDRMAQLQDVQDALAQELTVTTEFVIGRFSEQVHLMHHDTVKPAISAENHPGTVVPKPMENAKAIPLFRAIYDNIKLSRITTESPELAGRRSWVEGNNTFTFGMIPEVTQQLLEWLPAFERRFTYASYYNFFGSYIGGPGNLMAATTVAPPGGAGGGGLPSVDVFVPHKHGLNTPYFRFLASITRALRDHGFRTWHNGTIRRLPDLTVTPVGGFTGVPGVETDLTDLQNSTPTYVEEFLTPGMFQAPFDIAPMDAGSLAFVIANPWVDPSQTGTFPMEFTFQPKLYPGWSNQTQYTVTRYDANGLVALVNGGAQGPLTFNRNVPPGEITWWVFRDATQVIDPDQ